MTKLFLYLVTHRASWTHVRQQQCSSWNSYTRHYEMQVKRSSLRITRVTPIKHPVFEWPVDFVDSRIGIDTYRHPNTVNEHGGDWGKHSNNASVSFDLKCLHYVNEVHAWEAIQNRPYLYWCSVSSVCGLSNHRILEPTCYNNYQNHRGYVCFDTISFQ